MTRELTLRTDPNALTIVSVTVAAAASSGVSAANAKLKGGRIISIYPTTNQDQTIKSVAIAAATGVITVELLVAATIDNVFNVVVQKR